MCIECALFLSCLVSLPTDWHSGVVWVSTVLVVFLVAV